VHYTGKLDSGEVFDTSREREPLAFQVRCNTCSADARKRTLAHQLCSSFVWWDTTDGRWQAWSVPSWQAGGQRQGDCRVRCCGHRAGGWGHPHAASAARAGLRCATGATPVSSPTARAGHSGSSQILGSVRRDTPWHPDLDGRGCCVIYDSGTCRRAQSGGSLCSAH
jgi:hypothetical protein